MCFTTVYYPLEPGEYVPIVFMPGLYGIAPLDFWSTLLAMDTWWFPRMKPLEPRFGEYINMHKFNVHNYVKI